jgi:hypothetical protein
LITIGHISFTNSSRNCLPYSPGKEKEIRFPAGVTAMAGYFFKNITIIIPGQVIPGDLVAQTGHASGQEEGGRQSPGRAKLAAASQGRAEDEG